MDKIPDAQQACPVAGPRFWRSRHGVGLVVLGAIAAYFLVTEHRAHLLGALPFLLLLACPLMHLFMHRGHGHAAHGPAAGLPPAHGEQP